HWEVEPDIIAIAKGIASGLPLGGIVSRADGITWPPEPNARTFGANPGACLPPPEPIALLEEGLIENPAASGETLLATLARHKSATAVMRDVRGMVLFLEVDFGGPSAGRDPHAFAAEVILACFRKGLRLLPGGERAIRLCPPLVVTPDQARTATTILDEVL